MYKYNLSKRISRFLHKDSTHSRFSTSSSRIESTTIWKDDITKSLKHQPSALFNIGATCYLNSAFQGISACDIFLEDINRLCTGYDPGKVEKLRVFKELLAILNGCSKRPMEISRNSIFQKWNKSGQQDSYEVLVYAMNEVYNELRKSDYKNKDLDKWLEECLPMRFVFQYEIKCDCGALSWSPLQSDLSLHVVIPMNKKSTLTLDQLIDRYFEKEDIEDFQCDVQSCKKRKASKLSKLHRPLPRTVCIHLQRTYFDGYKIKKIDNDVEFSNEITLKPQYCADETSDQRRNESSILSDTTSRRYSSSVKREVITKGKCETYSLVSVIVHYGTVNGGHYVCYKRVGCNWFLTNDTSVKLVKESDVLKCQAYILFYEQSDGTKHSMISPL